MWHLCSQKNVSCTYLTKYSYLLNKLTPKKVRQFCNVILWSAGKNSCKLCSTALISLINTNNHSNYLAEVFEVEPTLESQCRFCDNWFEQQEQWECSAQDHRQLAFSVPQVINQFWNMILKWHLKVKSQA